MRLFALGFAMGASIVLPGWHAAIGSAWLQSTVTATTLAVAPLVASAAETGLSPDSIDNLDGTAAVRECFKRALLKVDRGTVSVLGATPRRPMVDPMGGRMM